jgi:hypothetical protein
VETIKFHATSCYTVRDKEKFFKQFKRFIEKSCPESLFTKPFCNHLSNMFGHIAYYDRNGFHIFSDAWKRYDFIQHILNTEPCGDPEWTWSDVEEACIQFLKTNQDIVLKYKRECYNHEYIVDLETVRNILNQHDEKFHLAVYEIISLYK